jgi:hypothetical protein
MIDPSGLVCSDREVLIQEGADVAQVGRDQNTICVKAQTTLRTR